MDKYNFYNNEAMRKIFSVGYEDLTTLVYYQDKKNKFILVVAKDDPPLILEKKITRAEAFRLMNTRP
ncbi:hypothetical protein [Pontibacter liquoris]|uniref:hypothetical protein n=1 Tax=Pontibacter liquoris TaxID=2905677 RepID=UPI001FA755FE|nr:hypothetical protein [Pontibacter liquoris]